MKKIIIGIAIVLLVAGGLGGIKMLQFKALMAAQKSFAQPPETVASAVAHEEKWQGTLTAIDHVPTKGKTPRNFAIDPSGRYLLAANQESNNIVVFRGLLRMLPQYAKGLARAMRAPTPSSPR